MVFDLDMIKNTYSQMAERIEAARKVVNKPLTLSEKILYSHLHARIRRLKHLKEASHMWISHLIE